MAKKSARPARPTRSAVAVDLVGTGEHSGTSRKPIHFPVASSDRRITAFFLIMVLLIAYAAATAVRVQVVEADDLARAAAEQLTQTQVLPADRGLILDRNGQHLAETQPAFLVAADPTFIATNGVIDPGQMTDEDRQKAEQASGEIAKILVRHLGGKAADYLDAITRTTNPDGSPNRYVMLKRHVAADDYQQMADELADQGWDGGIYSLDDPVRYYPNGSLAANVLGFVNADGEGASGLEYSENELLTGVNGTQSFQSATYGRIPLGDTTLVEPVDGATFQLTIDVEMQWMAETELVNTLARHNAASGTVVIMAVQTGEILALANAPSFDSNHPGDANVEDLGNRAVTDSYEPGSVQKVLTFAALLDSGTITPDTPVDVNDSIESGGGQIRDAWPHGTMYMTARGVLARSSNVGTVTLARQIPKQTLVNYLSSFGLGSATAIQLPGEPDGTLGFLPGGDMADYALDQVSFGQGLSVTAIQEAAAVAAVTNGGVYHQPTIIRQVTLADGEDVAQQDLVSRRVISQQASADVLNMMEASVASPQMTTADSTMIPGYRMAGKSGTAQKIGEFGNYDGGYIASYVAIAPVENPQILVYVVIDEPTNGYYGGQVAFPAARELMIQALPRYGIAPRDDIPEYSDPLDYV